MSDDVLITPDQSRAARALLDWSQDQLATKAGISAGSVRHFEKGRQVFAAKSQRALCEAFATAGVQVFPENGGGAGVRFATPGKKSAKKSAPKAKAKARGK